MPKRQVPRETEFVAAGKLREGDELPRYGTITRILNDSTVLSVDTTLPPYGFMKSQHAPVERYVNEEDPTPEKPKDDGKPTSLGWPGAFW
jgi:hypothetical protein